MKEHLLRGITTKSFGIIAGTFLLEAIVDMIPWLIAMFFVIVCDLITGCRKSIIMGKSVRFSRAWRATMGKMVTYFSFVVMVVLIDHACGGYQIDRWAVLFICFVEGCSIISNILHPKGYELNLQGLVSLFGKKLLNIEKEDTKNIIRKKDHDETAT